MVKNPKENILVLFSGGETSGYMINWLLKNKPNYNYKFIFDNTGEETEQTLVFVKNVAEYFGIEIVWLEYEELGYKIVDFNTAYRSHDPEEIKNGWQNHPFRKYIQKFGIPNIKNLSCSRELKERITTRYMSQNGWKPSKYDKAIGIRADELNRVGDFYYPLIQIDATKQLVNAFWDKMPFRLNLKGWEGNCKVCYKKSIRKLITIARHYPERFAFFKLMEEEFGNYIRSTIPDKKRKEIKLPIRFFRENKSVDDIFRMALDPTIEDAEDDSLNKNYQFSMYHDGTELDVVNGCVESCTPFN